MKSSATATKIQVHERLVGGSTVRPGHQRVGAHAVEAPDGVGNAGEDRPAKIGRRHRHEPWNDPVVGADHGVALIRQEVGADELSEAHEVRLVRVDIAAGHLEVAADGHEANQGPGSVKGMEVMFEWRLPHWRAAGLAQHTSVGLAELIGRDPGNAATASGV